MTATPTPVLVRTQADLESFWRSLMEPLGFSGRALWFMLLVDDRTTDVLVEISDLPAVPEPQDLAGFGHVIGDLAADDARTRVALLLARPGSAVVTEADRAWARGLLAAIRAAGATAAPLHLATDEALRVVAPDDLAAPAPTEE